MRAHTHAQHLACRPCTAPASQPAATQPSLSSPEQRLQPPATRSQLGPESMVEPHAQVAQCHGRSQSIPRQIAASKQRVVLAPAAACIVGGPGDARVSRDARLSLPGPQPASCVLLIMCQPCQLARLRHIQSLSNSKPAMHGSMYHMTADVSARTLQALCWHLAPQIVKSLQSQTCKHQWH